MVQRSFTIQTTEEEGPIRVKRVDKREARKRFSEGEDIYIEACNFNFANRRTTSLINNKRYYNFDIAVNLFEYYNCNSDAGTYASFYVADN